VTETTQPVTADDRRLARQAILVTCAVYVGFGLVRLVSTELAGFGLVAAFLFLPGYLLREHEERAREDEVGPESPIPPFVSSGWRTALWAIALIFPPFVAFTLWFYSGICAGDTALVDPLLWAEGRTPWAGSLQGFWAGQCRHYGGSFFPEAFVLPAQWAHWANEARQVGIPYALGALGGALLDIAIGLFAVALPEEVFHRGYLMGALDRRWPPGRKIFGVRMGWGAVLSSLLFALGHLIAFAQPVRLATFFPALVFAWLWRKSGSLWAPALFHFASNLLMQLLLASLFAGT
jgi:membrane protease YdiL (CAAX protease family)